MFPPPMLDNSLAIGTENSPLISKSQPHRGRWLIFLILIGVVAVVLHATNATGEPHEQLSNAIRNRYRRHRKCMHRIFIGNGNRYDFGTDVCKGYRNLWDPPSVPNEKRNAIGRGIWFGKKTTSRAKKLIKLNRIYDMTLRYTSKARLNIRGETFHLELDCQSGIAPGDVGGCFQKLQTVAHGNTGTQFDYLSHIFYNDSKGRTVFWNNFRGEDVMQPQGLRYIGIQNMVPIFTRMFLLDVAAYKKVDVLPGKYLITAKDILGTLKRQGVKMRFRRGDAVLFWTNWLSHLPADVLEGGRFPRWFGTDVPGLAKSGRDLLFFAGTTVIGMDMPTIDNTHGVWLTCGGGFLHEGLNATVWVNDARAGNAPYVGAYMFSPIPMEGAPASMGRPIVFV